MLLKISYHGTFIVVLAFMGVFLMLVKYLILLITVFCFINSLNIVYLFLFASCHHGTVLKMMKVHWDKSFSAPFSVYLDGLLQKLADSGVGCHWGHLFAGAVCYADDIVLLAPCLSALRILLNICSSLCINPWSKIQC